MKTFPIIFVFRSSCAVLLALMTFGCRFDPATEYVHSDTTPEKIFDKGMWWIPIKSARSPDEWFFLPEPAAVVAGDTPHRPGLSVDVLVNGKVWRCIKKADGNMTYARGINPPNVPPTDGMIISWVVGAAAVLLTGLFLLGAMATLQRAVQTATATDAKERRLAEDQERQSQIHKKNLEQQQNEQQRQAAVAEALRAEREEFEQLRNTHLTAIRETKIERTPPTQAEWKTLSEAVRAHQFRGQGTGQGLVVDYFFDPKTSGALTFNWTVNWDRAYTPTLVVCRDGKEIRRETGMFNGEFGSQLLKRANPYVFTFTLFDGAEELPNPLLIELTLPPFDAYSPEPPKPITPEERREKREAKRRYLYEQAEQLIKDPQKLKQAKAQIDHEIVEEFGEE